MRAKGTHVSLEETRFRRSPRTLWRTSGSEVLLTETGRDDFDRLSEAGSAIWALLDVPRSPKDIAVIVAEAYGVSPEAILPDVGSLLGALRDRGWVEAATEPDD